MTTQEFSSELLQNLEFPFDTEDVDFIESNCGSVWIQLKNGKSYFVSVGKCEDE